MKNGKHDSTSLRDLGSHFSSAISDAMNETEHNNNNYERWNPNKIFDAASNR